MQELSEEIRDAIDDSKEEILDVPGHLRETAKKWASYCLEKLDGDLLKEGLNISAAIVNFLNEREEV